MEPKPFWAVYRGMGSIADVRTREVALSRLRDEYRRVRAGLAATRMASPHQLQLRGLRIRLRIFLDEHRRALARDEAAAVRALIEEVDHTIARL